MGETDIIASRGRLLALIEVKARPSRDIAAEAIGPYQRERLAQAGEDFLARHPRFSRQDVRFDVMLVVPWRWPEHVKDAWRVE